MRALRISLCILLIPGIHNFVWFHFLGNFNRDGFQISEFSRMVNLITACLTVVSIWFWGLAILERIAEFIYWALGRNSSREQWQAQLHQALRRSPTFAFLGAILWTIWTMAIYPFQLDFFLVSVPIGIASHLLAACLYLPLFYRWYQLARDS